jgi:hypothetical protein
LNGYPEKQLRQELQMEIERANSLAARSGNQPGSAQRPKPGLSREDPKLAQVVRLYEDLTNLLVTNLKHSASQWLNLDEWTMTCVYTFMDDPSEPDRQFSMCSDIMLTTRLQVTQV